MVAPVTGPFTVVNNSGFTDDTQVRYRQKRPYNLVLTYRRSVSSGFNQVNDSVSGVSISRYTSYNPSSAFPGRKITACQNAAVEKLRGRAMDSAGWAENIAQIQKTRKSLVERAVQMSKFVSAVRHGHFGTAANVLRTPLPSKVSHRKALAQNILEYEYGIKPLVKDIQDSHKILTRDFGVQRIFASARESDSTFSTSRTIVGSNNTYSVRSSGAYLQVKAYAGIRVTNPDLLLANQLGLIDLALPWKVLPFSFIVDWFINVEQVLSSYTSWYGLQLVNPGYTKMFRGVDLLDGFTTYKDASGKSQYATSMRHVSGVHMERSPGLPAVTLNIKPFRGFSVERGVQAISLVLSVFGR